MTGPQTEPGSANFNQSFIGNLKERWQQFRSRSPRTAWVLRICSWLMMAGLGSLLLLFVLVWAGAFGKLPSQDDLRAIQNHAASEVYSADGVLLGKYFIENRKNVGMDEISPDIVNALIATEDARFFEHSGIDLRAWGRVFLRTILMRDESGGGGSTLSQQLAKNLFPRGSHWKLSIPVNKFKEMVVARRLEKVYSKDELINLYLNTVPFGVNIFGVEVAAKQFFNTTAKDIKTEEAAVLVGMLKANTYYNPVRNPDNALDRRNTVLHQMHRYGYLSETAADSLQALELKTDYSRESNQEGLATYFREHLRQELAESVGKYTKPDGTPYNLYTDGLRIHTTIHARMQDYAERAVRQQMSQLQQTFNKHWKGRKIWGKEENLMKEVRKSKRYKNMEAKGKSEEAIMAVFEQPIPMTVFGWDGDETREMSPLDSIKYYYAMLNAGFMAMDPGSGYVRAWVGGIDFKYFQYDHVKSTRQVGSTFKPIVYASAIKSGFRPCDLYHNRLVTYTEYKDWRPENSDGQYGGLYSMQGALSKSVNSIAVDLIVRTGVDTVRQMAHKLGIESAIPNEPSIALGTAELSLKEMVRAYGTFANRGQRTEPSYLLRIEDSKGQVLEDFTEGKAEPKRVLSVTEADIMTHLMEGVVDSGTARRLRYAYGLYGDIAGKTGTTQSHADGWFVGYTPSLVAGAWVGGMYPNIRFRSISLGQGANTALPIWGLFMQQVYKDPTFKKWKNQSFPAPGYEVVEALDCMPFVEEEPEEEFLVDSFDDALDGLLRAFKKNKKDRVNTNPREQQRQRTEQKRQEERERIQKRNEKTKKKREKKEKRKEFWDKLMKRN